MFLAKFILFVYWMNIISFQIFTFFLDYCKWLSNKFTRFTLAAVIIAYWGIGIYGILQVKPGLKPSKLFIKNSSIVEVKNEMEDYKNIS